MIKALAPTMRRGYSWVCLSIVGFVILPGLALAQAGKTGTPKDSGEAATRPATKPAAKDDKAADDAPAKNDAKDAKKGAAEKPAEAAEEKSATVEIFRDNAAAAILENKSFKQIGKLPRPQRLAEAVKEVRSMAAGDRPLDLDIVNETVDYLTYILTTPSVIQGLTDVDLPRAQAVNKIKDFRDAVTALTEPINDAKKVRNTAFIDAYHKVLLAKLPPLLKNNFYARIEAIILLSNIENVDALKVFTAVLSDREQTRWVQLRAMKGISTVAGFGARDLPAKPAVEAAKAIVGLLGGDLAMPWPAQVRALEALGSLRLAKDPTQAQKLEFATVIMGFLANEEARPEVRATAAWAMGMIRIDGAVTKFNYPLVAYYVGGLAADLGEQANRSFDKSRGMTELCTSLLLYKLHGAFEGTPEARDSGLLHGVAGNAALAQAKPFLKQADDHIAPVARAALGVLRVTPGQVSAQRKELSQSVASLRQFLEKNTPTNTQLIPGGKDFPVKAAEVAKAPGGQ